MTTAALAFVIVLPGGMDDAAMVTVKVSTVWVCATDFFVVVDMLGRECFSVFFLSVEVGKLVNRSPETFKQRIS